MTVPTSWKETGFWASVAAAVLNALALAPPGLGAWRLTALAASIALPLVFVRVLHGEIKTEVKENRAKITDNAAEIVELKKNGNGHNGNGAKP